MTSRITMMTRVTAGARQVARLLRGRRAVTSVVVLVVLVTAVVGLARLQVDTRAESFLPSDDPAARTTAETAAAFGGDPIVVVLESAEPRALVSGGLGELLDLEGRLAALPDVAAVYGPATVLNQIAGRTQDLLIELTGRRDGLRIAAEADALRAGADQGAVTAAGRDAVVAFDQRYGTLLARGLPGGLPTLFNPQFVETVLFAPDGLPNPQWRFVLPRADAVSILVRPRQDLDQAAVERLVGGVREAVAASELDVSRTTVSGVPTVAAAMAGQVRGEVPVLGAVALVAVGAWFLCVRWVGLRRRLLPLLSTVAATAFTLGAFGLVGRPISLGVVGFLPILIGVGSDFMTYLTRGADRRVVVAVALSAASAFASLSVLTSVRAIQDLGLALGVGMVVALLASLWIASRSGVVDLPVVTAGVPLRAPAARRWGAVGAAVAVAALGWSVLPLLELRADVQDFAAGLAVVDDAEHVERVIGSSGEVVLLVGSDDVLSPEAVDWMARAQQEVVTRLGDRMRPVLSPPGLMPFLGADATQLEIDSAVRLLPGYLTGAVVTGDRELALMSFGVRFDGGEQMADLRDDVLATLPLVPDGLTVSLGGLPVMAGGGHDAVSAGRYAANLLGIGAAGLVLAVVLRRRCDAALAVAAALIATGSGLLGMWLIGLAFTPVTIALGSLAAAVGCEFTVLLAEAARRGDRLLRRTVFLAAAASATGYGVLALSRLSVVAEFGVLLAIAVFLAVGAATLVVWAAGVGARVPPVGAPAQASPIPVGVPR